MSSLLDRFSNAQREVRFWRCADERAQAFTVAADIEQLIGTQKVQPQRIAVMVASMESESRPVAGALKERAIPHHLFGRAAFFERAEVRDVLAWIRLLVDPGDAGANVRALVRPPVELRQVDLARVVQIARRRKLAMLQALLASTELPHIPPEARERIGRFIALQHKLAAALDELGPGAFLAQLIESLELGSSHPLSSAGQSRQRAVSVTTLQQIAEKLAEADPRTTARALCEQLLSMARGESELDLDAQRQASGDASQPDPEPEAVQVMGLRASTELEFDHIYLVGLHGAQAVDGDEDGSVESIIGAAVGAREGLVLAYPEASADGRVRSPASVVEDARLALGAEWEDRVASVPEPEESLRAAVRAVSRELLEGVTRLAGRLGELRLDTDLDISHGVVRYLELVKLVALLERPQEQSVAEALGDVNARLFAAASPMQREILESSPLDEALLATERGVGSLLGSFAREERSLESFLPRKGAGLLLSASDVETYRSCPLRYKYARVLKIPSQPTINQRFGIVVHQVLERYHVSAGTTLGQLLELLDVSWQRSGLGSGETETRLLEMAREALTRYHEELLSPQGEPVWFERSFSFQLGPHRLRGRVDRVDRLADGSHELIDYKTGRPKSESQLRDDIQLSLYALAARESWKIEASSLAYYYVLDARKVPLGRESLDLERVTETVMEVAESIRAERFDPTPSDLACSICDYRIVCPAAER